jgi:chemotaxis protein methyltransferase WspC
MSARELLRQASGLNLSEQAVERALRERMARCGVADAGLYMQYLQNVAPAELAALIELVVVPESWMFRDADAFAAAVAHVRNCLAGRPERVVRILSIPCAAGEEPYSMAMALADAGVAPASFRIEGVDLSAAALERAHAGRYTRNAFRGDDLGFRQRHFSRQGDQFQISDALRAQVSFSQANLLGFDSVAETGRYDVVFCRNLLIYFDEPTTAAAIAVLRTVLADDGVLFAGYAEVPAFCRHGFAPLRLRGAFALHKAGPGQGAAAPARTARPPRTTARAPTPAPVASQRPPRPIAAPAAASTDVDLVAQARRLADGGDHPGAAAACHALLASNPDSADAYFILGMLSECAHDQAAAEDHWRRCVYLEPGHYDALCHLALLAERGGDAPRARALRQRAARIFGRRQPAGGAAP